jgi:hypothetical protein
MTPKKVTSGCGNSYERRTSAFAQLALDGTASVCRPQDKRQPAAPTHLSKRGQASIESGV